MAELLRGEMDRARREAADSAASAGWPDATGPGRRVVKREHKLPGHVE